MHSTINDLDNIGISTHLASNKKKTHKMQLLCSYIHFPIYVEFSKQKRAFVYFSIILKEADATLK